MRKTLLASLLAAFTLVVAVCERASRAAWDRSASKGHGSACY